jgi:TNF receptor-associated protein 1
MAKQAKKPGANTESFTYQAEVANVLDIVINSLYTDKEIFVRELVSNAADALEKIRHLTLTEKDIFEKDLPLEIKIDLDEESKTFTISDTGVGMTRDELVGNLGSIAHSGSANFLSDLAETIKKDINLIGQFGVGFYSAFMVADKISVKTRSYEPDSQGYEWTSEGSSGFSIKPVEGLSRGTRIILSLKSDASEFSSTYAIRRIIQKYSNFVSFPISVNGEKANTIEAIWSRNKSEITTEEYTEFYKFISGSQEEPLNWLHFSTDAPLSIHALLFIPPSNLEKFGFGKQESNVDLHCRKVLIQRQAKGILPLWLRFVTGIVDSEDIPLNISRETMQDSALIKKISRALTSKFIKFLDELARDDEEKYMLFWKTYGQYLKEGIVTDPDHRESLSRHLRFESANTEPGKMISLDQYVEQIPESQKEIYFISGSNRESIESSPYFEVFKTNKIDVIYNFDAVDDFVMMHLEQYKDRKLVSAETENLNIHKKDTDDADKTAQSETADDDKNLGDWIRKILQDKILDVRPSIRLTGSSMILVTPDGQMTGAMQQFLKTLNDDYPMSSKRILEFNPGHTLIKKLSALKGKSPELAETVLEQMYDHAALVAGLSVNTRDLVSRMDRILERVMTPVKSGSGKKRTGPSKK